MSDAPRSRYVRCRCGMMRAVEAPVCMDCFHSAENRGHGGGGGLLRVTEGESRETRGPSAGVAVENWLKSPNELDPATERAGRPALLAFHAAARDGDGRRGVAALFAAALRKVAGASTSGLGQTIRLYAEALSPRISQLPPEFAEAVALGEIENLGAAEIADRLGIGEADARTRLRSGRRRMLQDLLRDAHDRLERRGGLPVDAPSNPDCPRC